MAASDELAKRHMDSYKSHADPATCGALECIAKVIYLEKPKTLLIFLRPSYRHKRSHTRAHTHPYERTHAHITRIQPAEQFIESLLIWNGGSSKVEK